MGRKSIYNSSDEKVQATQDYQKQYYQTKKETTIKYSVINNAIERIKKDERCIQMFIDSVGHDVLFKLMHQKKDDPQILL
jgi:hypothetical protein